MTQPLHWREQVEEVSVDMWGGFPKVIAQVFPNTHCIRPISCYEKVNDALNKLRILLGITDRNSKYLLLSNFENLSKKQQQELEQVLRISLYPNCLWNEEDFRQIFETSSTFHSGRNRIEKWLRYAQLFLSEVSQTIRQHLEFVITLWIGQLVESWKELIIKLSWLNVRAMVL